MVETSCGTSPRRTNDYGRLLGTHPQGNLVAEAAKSAGLLIVVPSDVTVINAHGHASRADAATQVNHPGAPHLAGTEIINNNARYSLAGGTNFANHSLLMISIQDTVV